MTSNVKTQIGVTFRRDENFIERTNMNIKKWQHAVHRLALDKGWYDGAIRTVDYDLHPLEIAGRLANVHGEVSEALECLRDSEMDTWHGPTGKPEGIGIELADAVIRIMDLCEAIGIDLEEYMSIKHEYNETQSRRHGGKAL